MLKHLLIKHSLAKTALILALHASVTFDAWTTVRVQNTPFPKGMHIVEDDPLMRPFAKGPWMYPAMNLFPLPFDLAIMKAKSKRAKILAFTLAAAAITTEVIVSKRNVDLYNQTAQEYHQQFICTGCRTVDEH